MDERLARLLGGAETAWLVDRALTRLERGRPLTGTVSLTGATPAQRGAVERLLGRRAGTGASLSVSLGELDRVLRAGGVCAGLAAAVVLLRGPVRDLPALAEERDDAWRAAFAALDAHIARRAALADWRAWLLRAIAGRPQDL
ncbi:TIGR02679 domain-containing protein, partial [Nonomuraea longicatena]|uniref:TIGR02679 domain-containing protein n=1 Tax=Nonomuraea longicatena TaxID=83682 RepID=UPI0031DCF2F9